MAKQQLYAKHLNGYLELEVLWQDSPVTALLFHPNPVQGGTMDNKVVSTLFRHCRDQGYNVVRYNSRGVGQSSGVATASELELTDALCVVDYIKGQTTQMGVAPTKFWLGGFSFGGYMACLVADRLRHQGLHVVRMALIAPSLGRLFDKDDFDKCGLSALDIDWQTAFLVYGDKDKLVAPSELQSVVNALSLPYALFEQTGHFFHGKLVQLKHVLAYFDQLIAGDKLV